MLTWDDDQTTAELQLRLQPATAMPTPAIAEVAIAKPAGTKPNPPAADQSDASAAGNSPRPKTPHNAYWPTWPAPISVPNPWPMCAKHAE